MHSNAQARTRETCKTKPQLPAGRWGAVFIKAKNGSFLLQPFITHALCTVGSDQCLNLGRQKVWVFH